MLRVESPTIIVLVLFLINTRYSIVESSPRTKIRIGRCRRLTMLVQLNQSPAILACFVFSRRVLWRLVGLLHLLQVQLFHVQLFLRLGSPKVHRYRRNILKLLRHFPRRLILMLLDVPSNRDPVAGQRVWSLQIARMTQLVLR